MPNNDKSVKDVLTRYGFTEADEQHYNLAYAHAQGLSLPQRIRLCVALLEPELTLEGSKLYRAGVLLKELCKEI